MKWLDASWWIGMEQLLALQCPSSPEGNYALLMLGKDQNRVKVLQSFGDQKLSEVVTFLRSKPKLPIVMALGSDFVMEAMVKAEQMSDPVSGVLGVKIDENTGFEYMQFPATQDRSLVAVIRKESVDAAMAPLQEFAERVISIVFSQAVLGEMLVSVSLPGPSRLTGSGQALAPSASVGANRLGMTVGDRSYFMLDGLFSDEGELGPTLPIVQTLESIGDALKVPAQMAYCYAALLHVWSVAGQSAHMPLQQKFKAYVQVSRLRQVAVVSSLALAVWFLGLFFLRMQLEREKGELENAYAQNLPVLNAIDHLDEKIDARKTLNAQLGDQTLRASNASYYLDRIAALVPNEVKLRELIVGPSEEDFKRQGIGDSSNHGIIVRGESQRSAPVTLFSQSLEQLTWVEELSIARSELDIQDEQYQFVFLIRASAATLDLP